MIGVVIPAHNEEKHITDCLSSVLVAANLGMSVKAYRNAGGFQHLTAHEDVRLVADLERIGARIGWTATNPVVTSSRLGFKCRSGFGEYLTSLGASVGTPVLDSKVSAGIAN